MRTSILRSRVIRPLAFLLALAAVAACGPRHHLDKYNFAGQSMAVIVLAPPAPGLLEAGYRVRASDDPLQAVATVVQAGATAAKNAEANRARERLDSAAARVDLSDALSDATVERAARYLGMRPVESRDAANFLMEVHVRSFGIDVRGRGAATLYMNAEVVLLDKATGREIWNVNVHGTDRLTPRLRRTDRLPGTVITAATLHTVSVADFQDALDQLVQLSANVVTDELRKSLRDVREK